MSVETRVLTDQQLDLAIHRNNSRVLKALTVICVLAGVVIPAVEKDKDPSRPNDLGRVAMSGVLGVMAGLVFWTLRVENREFQAKLKARAQ